MDMNRWLFIRNGGIGDTVLLSSTVQAVRLQKPDSWIELMGIQERVELLVGPGLANRAASFERPGIETLFAGNEPVAGELREYLTSFDAIIYYAGKDHARLEQRLRMRDTQFVHVHPVLPEPGQPIHITQHYLKALYEIFPKCGCPSPRIVLRDNELDTALHRFMLEWGVQPGSYLSAMHPGAGNIEKRAPIDLFIQFVRLKMDRFPIVRPVIIQGPADEESVDALRRALPQSMDVIVLKDLSLREIAACLDFCNDFAGNDSGVAHIAAALGTPTTIFFTASEPRLWAPLGSHVCVKDLR